MKSLGRIFGSPSSLLDLEKPLLKFSSRDIWRIRDAFEGVQVFGATGSGKTSGSGAALAKAFLRNGFGGLVLTAKPTECALWQKYCRQTGREDSLIIFGPQNPHFRFNFLDYEYRRPGAGAGLTQNLLTLFSSIIEVAERSQAGGSSQDYWQRTTKQLFRNCIDLAAISKDRVTLSDLHSFVTSAAQSPEEVNSPDWQEQSACWRAIQDGEAKDKSPSRAHDFELTLRYWLQEFPALAPKTRSIIVSSFTSLIDVFLRGTLYEIFCTRTTVVPEMTHAGAIIVMDLSVKEYAEVGQLAQVLFKFLWQRATERRDLDKYPCPVFLYADEAQLFVNSNDAVFQSTARSSRTCTVYLTQNLPAYFAALGGERSKPEVNALLGNLQTKVFHANGDSVTNNWAAELFSKNYEFRTTSGTSTRDSEFGRTGRSHNTGSHESLEHQVLPIEFSSQLRKGGPENDWTVDAFVFQGRLWQASGRNFLKTSFHQDH